MRRLATTVTIVVAGAAAVAYAPVAQATEYAPSKYENVTRADRDFLRLVDGWANRVNSKIDAFNRAERADARIDRLRRLSELESSAASSVRFALKHGTRPSYRPPVTPCVRRVGAQFAHSSAAGADLYSASYVSAEAVSRAFRRYGRQIDRTKQVARACQRATAS